MMLVVVIGFFLTTEIPLLVITVLHTLDNRSDKIYLYSVESFSIVTSFKIAISFQKSLMLFPGSLTT